MNPARPRSVPGGHRDCSNRARACPRRARARRIWRSAADKGWPRPREASARALQDSRQPKASRTLVHLSMRTTLLEEASGAEEGEKPHRTGTGRISSLSRTTASSPCAGLCSDAELSILDSRPQARQPHSSNPG